MLPDQFEFFKRGPEGLKYADSIITADEEVALVRWIADLPLTPFEFHNFLGKRRVVSFGWRYVFDGSGLEKLGALPPILLALRDRIALFSGGDSDSFEHAMVTEYAAGAAIGWHRDRSVFEDVVGISLLSEARLRFRRKLPEGWERFAQLLQPRSAYLLSGEARNDWEHSIPPGGNLRYSITFRNFRGDPGEL